MIVELKETITFTAEATKILRLLDERLFSSDTHTSKAGGRGVSMLFETKRSVGDQIDYIRCTYGRRALFVLSWRRGQSERYRRRSQAALELQLHLSAVLVCIS